MDNSDITINNHEATWVLPPTDGILGGTYKGTFTFRCYLDPLTQLKAGREYRSLLGELALNAPDSEANLGFALTQLKYRVISAPPFWTSTQQDSGISGNVGDLNIISMVLEKALEAESLFKERIQKEREELLNKSIEATEKLSRKNAGEQ